MGLHIFIYGMYLRKSMREQKAKLVKRDRKECASVNERKMCVLRTCVFGSDWGVLLGAVVLLPPDIQVLLLTHVFAPVLLLLPPFFPSFPRLHSFACFFSSPGHGCSLFGPFSDDNNSVSVNKQGYADCQTT